MGVAYLVVCVWWGGPGSGGLICTSSRILVMCATTHYFPAAATFSFQCVPFAESGICIRCKMQRQAPGTTRIVVVSPPCTLISPYVFTSLASPDGTPWKWNNAEFLHLARTDTCGNRLTWRPSSVQISVLYTVCQHLLNTTSERNKMAASAFAFGGEIYSNSVSAVKASLCLLLFLTDHACWRPHFTFPTLRRTCFLNTQSNIFTLEPTH